MKTEQPGEQAGDLPADLSQPAQRALAEAGYTHLAQLAACTEAGLLRLHGVGPKTITQLRRALVAQGRAFAPGKAAPRT